MWYEKISWSQNESRKCRLVISSQFSRYNFVNGNHYDYFTRCCFGISIQKEIPHSVHCASLKYISDCLCVKSTILLHHSNGALHENDPIFPFECYINTFSMKNYAFVEHQCSKWYSNGMVWFLTYQRKERKKQKCLFWWRCEMLIMHFQSY